MSGRLGNADVQLATRGVAVFQLAPGTKVPLAGSHGFLEATSDPDVTRARWAKTPRANIAAATGSRTGFWVLDVDAQHEGEQSLTRVVAEHGPLPPTIEASTPSGGRHLFWRWPASGDVRNSTSRIGPGLDVRGEGGSVTLPPSVLADGRRYRWARNGAAGFADAPAWLVALAMPPPRPEPVAARPLTGDVSRYIAAAITSELRQLDQAGEGQRNDTLNRASFNVAQFVGAEVVPEDWARKQLEAKALAIGLSAVEARRTIKSAFAAGMARPRELPR